MDYKIDMKASILPLICILLSFLLILDPLSPFAEAQKVTKTNITIEQGKFIFEVLQGIQGIVINISVAVVTPVNYKIDVYVIPETSFGLYPYGDFTSSIVREGIIYTKFLFTFPDDQIHYLVIDNLNSSRDTDTIATKNVKVSYEYDNPSPHGPGLPPPQPLPIQSVIAIGVAALFFVLLIVIMIVLFKQKRPPAKR